MDLAKMCRVCLLQEDRVQLLDWHQPIDSLEYVLSYKECFCKCTQINFSLKDDPTDTGDTRIQYLCFCCAQSLQDAHEFIEKAKKADNELRSRQIDKTFEWVTVNAKDMVTVLKEDPVVDDKNCLDEINETNTWKNQNTDEKEMNTANDVDEEDIPIANLKKELEENYLVEKRKPARNTKHKRKEEILDDDTKSEDDGDDEDFMGDAGIASRNESDKDSFSEKNLKAVPKKKEGSKMKTENPRKSKAADPNEMITCELCQKVLKRSTLKKHKQRHKKPKKIKVNLDDMMTCDVCNKVMTRKALRQHKRVHKPRTFLCKACPRTFSKANNLKNHERTHDENREKFPCEKCDQTFVSIYSYRAHLNTHDVNRKPTYKCTQCDKAFFQKGGLNTHMLYHEGLKWKCSFCDKRYVRESDLKVHVRTHSGETPYQCNICGKSFIHKPILNKHMQQHGAFFRYTCVTCGEQFEKYGKYYVHRQQHFGLPYKCGVCERQFNDSFKCKRHVRGVHKITEDSEVGKLSIQMYDTKEHRGIIVEVIKNPLEQEIV